LISIVFIRLLSALLVAARQFRAAKSFVSLHCFPLRRPPAQKSGSVRFVRNRIALPRRGEESNPVPSKTKRKNMNTTENFVSTPQPSNNIVKPFKFPPQPQEWKIVSLRECPTPADIQLCDTPEQAAAYWKMHIEQHPYFNPECECLVVLILNTRRKIKGHYFVSVGTMDTVLCEPKSVFRLAVMASAAGIIVMHNHPSGESSPSQADIQVTRDLIRGGQLLKIDVVDHVVIGNGNHSSLRALGYCHQ
jgi:proteasome lid subunit RPN8/RPN11